MGGNPPLGYDAKDKKLVVNEAEAETVRMIFRSYTELDSVRELKRELDHQGVVSKVRVNPTSNRTGGQSFARGALYRMLQNPLYRGQVAHKGKAYPGEHLAIVDISG